MCFRTLHYTDYESTSSISKAVSSRIGCDLHGLINFAPLLTRRHRVPCGETQILSTEGWTWPCQVLG